MYIENYSVQQTPYYPPWIEEACKRLMKLGILDELIQRRNPDEIIWFMKASLETCE